ncbi:MAG: glutamate--cysteine ligase [Bdellovibrionales bacterium]|nr:glutamate--cysteine ligase [Bdellovibrionales bacterium]
MTESNPSETKPAPRRKKSPIDANDHLAFKRGIAEKIRAKESEIRDWYSRHAKNAPPPMYCSVDLRDSGHKIVPVDSNLYPAGFNNVCPEDHRTAPPIFREALRSRAAREGVTDPKQVLILPEFHTTNTYYLENLYYLKTLVETAGFEVRIGWLSEPAIAEGLELRTASEKILRAYPLRVNGGRAEVGSDGETFVPDVILLNNDFSGGYPPILDTITQPILPSHRLGWHTRKKSEHFKYYNRLAKEFAEIAGFDPWIIQIETEEVDHVDFNEDVGTDRVADVVERVLKRTKEAYVAHGVKTEPFAFVKNNAGTYGIGIMVAHSADEIRGMNRRTKNKMSVGKNKRHIDSIVVQEGVPTATLVDRLASEPVIYLFGCELIGGFLRTNTERGIEENLNSQGMVFRKLCMSDLREEPEEGGAEDMSMEQVYGAVARISALATGLELKDRLGNNRP